MPQVEYFASSSRPIDEIDRALEGLALKVNAFCAGTLSRTVIDTKHFITIVPPLKPGEGYRAICSAEVLYEPKT